jgi:carbamoyl-phosphate synthase large subunit
MVVIEMNPRVSRSSALASKATGFPIAKIAAKLAVGYSLDELRNDITRLTPASFEPTIDYVVTKIPRFTFEKFPDADPTLTSAMKSVGEAMAIGRTFKESVQKALRSLEVGARGFGGGGKWGGDELPERSVIVAKLATPNSERIFFLRYAFLAGFTVDEIFELTKIDPWFLHQLREIYEMEQDLKDARKQKLNRPAPSLEPGVGTDNDDMPRTSVMRSTASRRARRCATSMMARSALPYSSRSALLSTRMLRRTLSCQ